MVVNEEMGCKWKEAAWHILIDIPAFALRDRE
jgi:hypothetical protein